MTAVALRMLLTGGLLVLAWRHAHWSVALILTLMAVNAEASALVHGWLRQRIERLEYHAGIQKT